jgi:hypothetical protein
MNTEINKPNDVYQKMKEALERTRKKLIVETKATNSYLVISDGKGGAKKVYAKDL